MTINVGTSKFYRLEFFSASIRSKREEGNILVTGRKIPPSLTHPVSIGLSVSRSSVASLFRSFSRRPILQQCYLFPSTSYLYIGSGSNFAMP